MIEKKRSLSHARGTRAIVESAIAMSKIARAGSWQDHGEQATPEKRWPEAPAAAAPVTAEQMSASELREHLTVTFHELWGQTAAGTYDKELWTTMQQLLHKLGAG